MGDCLSGVAPVGAGMSLGARVERLETMFGLSPVSVAWPHRRTLLLPEVARLWQIEPAVLTGPSRLRYHVLARAAAVLVLRETPEMSYPDIGRMLGGRDHSTVLNLHRIGRAALAERPEFAAAFALLKSNLMKLKEALA